MCVIICMKSKIFVGFCQKYFFSEVFKMSDTVGMIILIIYAIIGPMAVKYVKVNIFGVVAEYTDNLFNLFLKNLIWGLFLGWLALPVAIIHWLIVGRNS